MKNCIIILIFLFGCTPNRDNEFAKTIIDASLLPIAKPMDVNMYEDTAPRALSGVQSMIVSKGKIFTRGIDNNFVAAYSMENFRYLGNIVTNKASAFYFWTGKLFYGDSSTIIIPREYQDEMDIVKISDLKIEKTINLRKLPKGAQRNFTGTTDIFQTQNGRWNTINYEYGYKRCAIVQCDIIDSDVVNDTKVLHDYLPEFTANKISSLEANNFYNRKRDVFVNAFIFERRFDIVYCQSGKIMRFEIKNSPKKDSTMKVQYSSVYGLEDSFVLHYWGYTTDEVLENPNLTSWFEEWDYEGNCIGRYSVNNVLNSDARKQINTATFCVTPERQIICWVSNSDKPIWIMKMY